jgi:hypothetical protein
VDVESTAANTFDIQKNNSNFIKIKRKCDNDLYYVNLRNKNLNATSQQPNNNENKTEKKHLKTHRKKKEIKTLKSNSNDLSNGNENITLNPKNIKIKQNNNDSNMILNKTNTTNYSNNSYSLSQTTPNVQKPLVNSNDSKFKNSYNDDLNISDIINNIKNTNKQSEKGELEVKINKRV